MKPRIAILAALSREIAPLVRDWPRRTQPEKGIQIWECDRAVAVCAGMGRKRVAKAFEMATKVGPLASVISVGFAGGLREDLVAGRAAWPAMVIDARTGARYPCTGGAGTLLTTDRVLGKAEKREAAARWNADLVDMEASAVAELACKQGLPFRTLRAVSDTVGDVLPDLNRFTDSEGQFREMAFAAYLALHPMQIPAVVRLGRNSSRAAEAIAQVLREVLECAE